MPSGWGHVDEFGPVKRFLEFFYEVWQFWGTSRPGHDKPIDFPFEQPAGRGQVGDDA